MLVFRKAPSREWLSSQPPGSTEVPTDADMVVEVILAGSYAYPSALKPYEMWDRGNFQIAPISIVPYLQWKAAADADIARKKAAAGE
jgi:hypothetical protein